MILLDRHAHELRVLLIEDDREFAALVGAQLARPDRTFESDLRHVEQMSVALEALEADEFDVILLDLGLPDERGLRSVKRVVERARDAAVVVVTGTEDPMLAIQAVAVGAQEYVLKREITPPLLERTIRYAVERKALSAELDRALKRERTERELRRLERLAGDGPSSVTAGLFGEGALKTRNPTRWGEMRLEYNRILDVALEERTHQIEKQATKDLRSLASVMGFVGATPRDVVTLHSEVINAAVEGAATGLAEAYVDEARILVLELMGHLASWYRTRAAVSAVPAGKGADDG